MNCFAQLKQDQQSRAVANTHSRSGPHSKQRECLPLEPLMTLQERVNLRPQVRHVAQLQQMLNPSPHSHAPVQKENRTGMPARLKDGIEKLSNLSLDNVRVQYNSPKPAQFQAHAITQGKDIHVGPGQEHHLPHEAWHVVQQKQGRVQATTQMHGTAINTDPALEREADVMGAMAARAPRTDKRQDHVRGLSRAGDEGLGVETSSSRESAHSAHQHSQPSVAQRVVVPIPATHPQQYRSTLISGQTFPSAAAAQLAEQNAVAAIEAERQRLAQERQQQIEAELERRRAERNPMFAPPPQYQQPVAMNNPPMMQNMPIVPLLMAREIGASNQAQLQAAVERLEFRRELGSVNPQLHQFIPDPYGDLGEI